MFQNKNKPKSQRETVSRRNFKTKPIRVSQWPKSNTNHEPSLKPTLQNAGPSCAKPGPKKSKTTTNFKISPSRKSHPKYVNHFSNLRTLGNLINPPVRPLYPNSNNKKSQIEFKKSSTSSRMDTTLPKAHLPTWWKGGIIRQLLERKSRPVPPLRKWIREERKMNIQMKGWVSLTKNKPTCHRATTP